MNGFNSKGDAWNKYLENNPRYAKYLIAQQQLRESKKIFREERLRMHVEVNAIKTKISQEYFDLKNRKLHEKLNRIVSLRKEGKTLEEIGREFGVTRERIRQLAALYIPDWKHRVLEKKYYTKICEREGCGKEFTVESSRKRKKTCSLECEHIIRNTVDIRHMTLEQWRAYNNERTKKYYRTHLQGTPEFKEVVRRRNKLQKEREKARALIDPVYAEKIAARRIRVATRHKERMKSDPIYIQKMRDRWNKQNAKHYKNKIDSPTQE